MTLGRPHDSAHLRGVPNLDPARASDRPVSPQPTPRSGLACGTLNVSLVPPQIAALASFLWTSFGISIGYEVRGVAGFIEGLAVSVVIAAGNWPFPVLYFVTRRFARKRWPQVGLIKAAMWGSTIAMAIPNVVVFLATPSELLSGPAYDRGREQGCWQAWKRSSCLWRVLLDGR